MNLDKMENNTYSLEITSWENDADNYVTKYIHNLKRNEVDCLLTLLSLFKNRKYTNMSIWSEVGCLFDELQEKFDTTISELKRGINLSDFLFDIDLDDFLDEVGMCSEEFRVRVLESVNVYKLQGNIIKVNEI